MQRRYSAKANRLARWSDPDDPVIHYGIIASADHFSARCTSKGRHRKGRGCLVLRNGGCRLMDRFPCAVIRGICGYADTHKTDLWQGYAAAIAAVHARELLLMIPSSQRVDAPVFENSSHSSGKNILYYLTRSD